MRSESWLMIERNNRQLRPCPVTIFQPPDSIALRWNGDAVHPLPFLYFDHPLLLFGICATTHVPLCGKPLDVAVVIKMKNPIK